MVFHENPLLADNSHEISYLIFYRKLGKMSQNLSSAAFHQGLQFAKVLSSDYKRLKKLNIIVVFQSGYLENHFYWTATFFFFLCVCVCVCLCVWRGGEIL